MNQPIRIFVNRFSNLPHNLLFGAGLGWAIENETYAHVPVVLVFPGAYAGYQLWRNREKMFPQCNENRRA